MNKTAYKLYFDLPLKPDLFIYVLREDSHAFTMKDAAYLNVTSFGEVPVNGTQANAREER